MSLYELIMGNNIEPGITSYVVEESARSLERFDCGDNVFYKLGEGKMLSPGHPSGNQMYNRMLPIIKNFIKQRLFPVFVKRSDGTYIYKGKYIYDSFRKKTSFEGFSYFEIRMLRKELPLVKLVSSNDNFCGVQPESQSPF
jgi:hypothetical protein